MELAAAEPEPDPVLGRPPHLGDRPRPATAAVIDHPALGEVRLAAGADRVAELREIFWAIPIIASHSNPHESIRRGGRSLNPTGATTTTHRGRLS